MRALIQRVNYASCTVEEKLVSEIDKGYVILLGISQTDTLDEIEKLVKKIVNLRIFTNEEGKLDLSIKDVNYEILSISQFTLYADTTKGNRPSFTNAMKSNEALEIYNNFNLALEEAGIKVKKGVFGSHMKINLENDGPVTILLEV